MNKSHFDFGRTSDQIKEKLRVSLLHVKSLDNFRFYVKNALFFVNPSALFFIGSYQNCKISSLRLVIQWSNTTDTSRRRVQERSTQEAAFLATLQEGRLQRLPASVPGLFLWILFPCLRLHHSLLIPLPFLLYFSVLSKICCSGIFTIAFFLCHFNLHSCLTNLYVR